MSAGVDHTTVAIFNRSRLCLDKNLALGENKLKVLSRSQSFLPELLLAFSDLFSELSSALMRVVTAPLPSYETVNTSPLLINETRLVERFFRDSNFTDGMAANACHLQDFVSWRR